MMVKMLKSGKVRMSGQVIRVSIPYIKEEIPVIILFRALGIYHQVIVRTVSFDFHIAMVHSIDMITKQRSKMGRNRWHC